MLHFRKMLTIMIIYKYNSGKQFVTRNYQSSTVQTLFMNVIYEDQVLYAPQNEVLFVRIKLLYAELSPFQIQLFTVLLSQYSTSGGLIYSNNTNFYCIP